MNKKEKEKLQAKYEKLKTPYDEQIKEVSLELSYCRAQIIPWQSRHTYMLQKNIKEDVIGNLDFYRKIIMNIELRVRMLEKKMKDLRLKEKRYQRENANRKGK